MITIILFWGYLHTKFLVYAYCELWPAGKSDPSPVPGREVPLLIEFLV